MATVIKSGSSNNEADVNVDLELQVAPTKDIDKAGWTAMAAEVDGGTVTGTRYLLPPEITDDYRLRVGVDTLLFQEVFSGAAVNTGIWRQTTATGGTITVSTGWLTLTNTTAATANCLVSSYRSFPIFGTYTLYAECLLQVSTAPQTNTTVEWGVGIAATTAAPTDGAFFRMMPNGEFRCILNNNGTELQSDALDFATLVGINLTHHYIIALMENEVEFWIDNVLVAVIDRANTGTGCTQSWNVPFFFRNYNTALAATTQVVKVSQCTVTMADMNSGRPWATIMAGSAAHSSQGQTSGTIGSTAQWANSADPSNAAPTNTTAALGSGLGGIFRANAQATAATDFIISSFQVPAGTATAPGKSLFVHGVTIGAINIGVAVATTATTLALGIAYGHTSVSLATTEAAAAKAPRRIGLGTMFWPVAAVVGATPNGGDVRFSFTSPICVQPGEFFQIICRFVTGTATGSQIIEFVIGVDGYFE